MIAADLKKSKTKDKIDRIFQETSIELGNLEERDRFIAGISLYAGDGRKGVFSPVEFTNTDPDIISFMMSWFRNFCNIPEEKLRGAL